MKNKILSGFAALSIAAIAVFNLGLVSKSSDVSNVSLANIEALAEGDLFDCLTGCVFGDEGCACYQYYPNEEPPHTN